MPLSKKDIEYTSTLAHVQLSEKEKTLYLGQLESILKYIEKLNELDTTNVLPMDHVLDLENVFRKDEIKPSVNRDQVLNQAPKQQDGFFLVPPVIE
ncbi:Asp-tRNA(Asn)/Glu-tRNA(Gln) amidotransferase subunit GatC [PVC group bacterium]|nr:Asp-tRNA(Asn)/Glu-tRNA(Gln) amidotransferase subunit GatC [PVC group bacterium]